MSHLSPASRSLAPPLAQSEGPVMSHARQLHAASLPFVTRALRGGRKLRYSGIALLLALLTLVLGTWLALGPGEFEHELRVGFKLEAPRYIREQREFRLFADDAEDLHDLRAAASALSTPDSLRAIARGELATQTSAEDRVRGSLSDALDIVTRVRQPFLSDIGEDLGGPAQALLLRNGIADLGIDRSGRWGDDETRAQLPLILARDLVPEVSLYHSPLSLIDAVRVVGLVAGAGFMLLLMLLAPVLAGTQMAQEVHENTLQPLTGTALSARELVLGMTLGTAAVIALIAAPQLLIFLAAAAAVGHILPALGLIAVCLAAGTFLTMLAQLAGLALGRQRSSGMLGVALISVLGPLTFAGAALALEMPRRAIGFIALLPQAAASHVLLASFAGPDLRSPEFLADDLFAAQLADTADAALIALIVGILGMTCFAWLGMKALERRVGELAPSALSRGEALFGALVSIVLVTLANPFNPDRYSDPAEFYLVNFAVVLVPMTVLLMMRVPIAEAPTALRRIPIGPLLGELVVAVMLYFAVCIGCMGADNLTIVESSVAMLYLAWTVAVAGLLTLRVTALPMTLLAKLWASLCIFGVLVAFVHAFAWTKNPHRPADEILVVWQFSPLLGVLQAVMIVLIPLMLLRALRHPASTAAVEP